MELRIKDVLKEKKVTVVSLAGMIGIAQPSMSNIVNGKSMPSLETLEKIAHLSLCQFLYNAYLLLLLFLDLLI